MSKSKCKLELIVSFFALVIISSCGFADETEVDSKIVYDFWKCTSPTNGFWGSNEYLETSGIEIGFSLTTVYQANAKGGISTNERRGRSVGRYDLEVSTDLEKLMGIKGGSFFLHGWGGWSDTEGIDGHSVGSALGINALAIGNRSMDVIEAFYEGPFFGDSLTIAAGKLDFTGIFDVSKYADHECLQFLNAAFVDDPAIPFSQQGLGVVLNWAITEDWYLRGGIADGQADSRETGFRTAFKGDDYFFYILETGIAVGNDNYRAGVWNDPQPKTNSDGDENYRDDVGGYTSCDWFVYEENPGSDDGQGLGVFARYGYAPSKRNDITNFFSAGLQYQGLFDSRDDDVFAVAYAHGTLSNSAAMTYPEDYESVVEVYYNAQIAPWFIVGPSVQYLANPGGSNTTKDAFVVGVRAHIVF